VESRSNRSSPATAKHKGDKPKHQAMTRFLSLNIVQHSSRPADAVSNGPGGTWVASVKARKMMRSLFTRKSANLHMGDQYSEARNRPAPYEGVTAILYFKD